MSTLNPIQTRFGTITDSQMILTQRGILGKRQRAIPLSQIASVRQDVNRHMGLGIFLLLVGGLAYTILGSPLNVLAATILSIIGALLLWGTPAVVITTTGGYTRRMTGTIGSYSEADRFVAGLRRALFDLSGN